MNKTSPPSPSDISMNGNSNRQHTPPPYDQTENTNINQNYNGNGYYNNNRNNSSNSNSNSNTNSNSNGNNNNNYNNHGRRRKPRKGRFYATHQKPQDFLRMPKIDGSNGTYTLSYLLKSEMQGWHMIKANVYKGKSHVVYIVFKKYRNGNGINGNNNGNNSNSNNNTNSNSNYNNNGNIANNRANLEIAFLFRFDGITFDQADLDRNHNRVTFRQYGTRHNEYNRVPIQNFDFDKGFIYLSLANEGDEFELRDDLPDKMVPMSKISPNGTVIMDDISTMEKEARALNTYSNDKKNFNVEDDNKNNNDRNNYHRDGFDYYPSQLQLLSRYPIWTNTTYYNTAQAYVQSQYRRRYRNYSGNPDSYNNSSNSNGGSKSSGNGNWNSNNSNNDYNMKDGTAYYEEEQIDRSQKGRGGSMNNHNNNSNHYNYSGGNFGTYGSGVYGGDDDKYGSTGKGGMSEDDVECVTSPMEEVNGDTPGGDGSECDFDIFSPDIGIKYFRNYGHGCKYIDDKDIFNIGQGYDELANKYYGPNYEMDRDDLCILSQLSPDYCYNYQKYEQKRMQHPYMDGRRILSSVLEQGGIKNYHIPATINNSNNTNTTYNTKDFIQFNFSNEQHGNNTGKGGKKKVTGTRNQYKNRGNANNNRSKNNQKWRM